MKIKPEDHRMLQNISAYFRHGRVDCFLLRLIITIMIVGKAIFPLIAVNNAVEEKKTSYALLPMNLFPSGGKFFSRYQFFWDRTGRRAVRDYW